MRTIILAGAFTMIAGAAFAQGSTGPANQNDNMTKPGAAGNMNNGTTTSGMSKDGMAKDGMKKDNMAKKGMKKDGTSK